MVHRFAVSNSFAIISSSLQLVKKFFILFKTFWTLALFEQLRYLIISVFSCQQLFEVIYKNGERGIWTLAPVARPTPLAGAPLRPLEYFSLIASAMLTHYTRITLILSITFSKFFNTFLTNQKLHISSKINPMIYTLSKFCQTLQLIRFAYK